MIVAFEVSRPIAWKPFWHTEYGGVAFGWLIFGAWISTGAFGDAFCRFLAIHISKEVDRAGGRLVYYHEFSKDWMLPPKPPEEQNIAAHNAGGKCGKP